METRLKERMTGAAILVALIVMLVPEMFRGQTGEVSTTSSSGGDGPPVRSYTIDLSNNPKHNGPLQLTTAAPAPATEAESARNEAQSKPEPAKPEVEAAKGDTAKADATKADVTKADAVKSSPASSQATAHVAKVPPASAPAPTTTAAKTAASGGWSVQLGIFSKRENAERLMHEIQAKGFNVAVSNADGKGMFHVHSTGLADRAAAQALSQKMKADGVQATVVAP